VMASVGSVVGAGGEASVGVRMAREARSVERGGEKCMIMFD
jgi:hypothetical protein